MPRMLPVVSLSDVVGFLCKSVGLPNSLKNVEKRVPNVFACDDEGL